MTRAPITLVVVLVAGCYDAPKPDCGFRCGPSAACPADYTCASDNRCHRNGSPPELVCATPDAMPPDAYSPRVVVTMPNAGATVDPATTIVVGFDVDVAGVTSTSFTVTITSTTTPVVGAIAYDAPTHRATFRRANGLPANAELLVELSSDIFDPVTNQALMPTSYAFRTGPDTTPPTITSTTPAAGATGVPVVAAVIFKFSELVTHVDNTSVNLLDGATPVVGTAFYDDVDAQAVFDPQDQLQPNHTYTVRVPNAPLGSVVTDAAGNPLAATFTMTFTTGADTFGPRVRVLVPQDGGTNVPVSSNIVVTFDEPAMGVDTTSFQVNGGAIAGTVTPSNGNRTWTFDPTSDLPAASLITISLSTAITDALGNAANANSFTFTTM